MPEWSEVELGDVLDVLHGFAFKGEYFGTGGPNRVVTPGNFIETGGFVDRGQAQKSYNGVVPSEFVLAPGALIVAMTEQSPGLLGSSGVIPDDGQTWLHNQRIGLIRLNEPVQADLRFVYYLLNTSTVRAQISATATGVKVRHTAPVRIRAVRAQLPGLGLQKRIARVLSAFDELIELNERRIEILEDLARSLYREWFVRFRFPGHQEVDLVDSKISPIPAGWSVKRLDEVATLTRTNVMPARVPETAFDYYSIPALDETRLPASELGATIKSGKYRLVEASVLISKLNPRIPRVWFADPTPGRESIASTEFLVWTTEVVTNSFLWAHFESESFRALLAGLAGGTSTSHQRAKPDDVAALPIVVPDAASLKNFDRFALPALELVLQLRRRSRALIDTRDLLLPRLVTGQIDISDVDLGNLVSVEDA